MANVRKFLSGGYLPGNLGDPLGVNKDVTVDTSALKDQAAAQKATGDQLQAERAGHTLDKTDQTQAATQQQGAIQGLADATSGRFVSPAEQQLQQQAAINAARQSAMAKAIGGHSAGGAAYRAAQGAAQTTADATIAGKALHANEMAAARGQLTDALGQARTQDLTAYQNDQNEKNALLAAQIQQQATQEQIAQANAQAQLQQQGVNTQVQGAQTAAAGAGLGQILSDYRAKTDVKPATTRAMASAIRARRAA